MSPTQRICLLHLIPPVLHNSGCSCESVLVVTYFIDGIISDAGSHIRQHCLDPLMKGSKSYGPCSTVRSRVERVKDGEGEGKGEGEEQGEERGY